VEIKTKINEIDEKKFQFALFSIWLDRVSYRAPRLAPASCTNEKAEQNCSA
jgi:hypothetical protein